MLVSRLGRDGDEKAHQEEDEDNCNKSDGVLESTPQSPTNRLSPLLALDLIVFLVPEVCERDYQQAEHGIQAVQQVVDNLQLQLDIIDFVGRRPVFLSAKLPIRRRRD